MKKTLFIILIMAFSICHSQSKQDYRRYGKLTSTEIANINVVRTDIIYTAFNTTLGIEVINKSDGNGWVSRFDGLGDFLPLLGGDITGSVSISNDLNVGNIFSSTAEVTTFRTIGGGTSNLDGSIFVNSRLRLSPSASANDFGNPLEGDIYALNSIGPHYYDGANYRRFILDGDIPTPPDNSLSEVDQLITTNRDITIQNGSGFFIKDNAGNAQASFFDTGAKPIFPNGIRINTVPVLDIDATSKVYVDDLVASMSGGGSFLPLDGSGTMGGTLNMGANNNIFNVGAMESQVVRINTFDLFRWDFSNGVNNGLTISSSPPPYSTSTPRYNFTTDGIPVNNADVMTLEYFNILRRKSYFTIGSDATLDLTNLNSVISMNGLNGIQLVGIDNLLYNIDDTFDVTNVSSTNTTRFLEPDHRNGKYYQATGELARTIIQFNGAGWQYTGNLQEWIPDPFELQSPDAYFNANDLSVGTFSGDWSSRVGNFVFQTLVSAPLVEDRGNGDLEVSFANAVDAGMAQPSRYPELHYTGDFTIILHLGDNPVTVFSRPLFINDITGTPALVSISTNSSGTNLGGSMRGELNNLTGLRSSIQDDFVVFRATGNVGELWINNSLFSSFVLTPGNNGVDNWSIANRERAPFSTSSDLSIRKVWFKGTSLSEAEMTELFDARNEH